VGQSKRSAKGKVKENTETAQVNPIMHLKLLKNQEQTNPKPLAGEK
jgi:hypothetical protein